MQGKEGVWMSQEDYQAIMFHLSALNERLKRVLPGVAPLELSMAEKDSFKINWPWDISTLKVFHFELEEEEFLSCKYDTPFSEFRLLFYLRNDPSELEIFLSGKKRMDKARWEGPLNALVKIFDAVFSAFPEQPDSPNKLLKRHFTNKGNTLKNRSLTEARRDDIKDEVKAKIVRIYNKLRRELRKNNFPDIPDIEL